MKTEMSSTQKSFDLATALFGAVLGAAVGLGGAFILIQNQNKEIKSLKEQNPPVVIVDFGEIVASYPEGASPDETEALMQKTSTAFVKLQKAGYLVLDIKNVLAAPKDLYLPKEVILDAQ